MKKAKEWKNPLILLLSIGVSNIGNVIYLVDCLSVYWIGSGSCVDLGYWSLNTIAVYLLTNIKDHYKINFTHKHTN